jgi:hypothetical protein
MGYGSSGRMPIERASKIGHMRFVESPYLRDLVQRFHDTTPSTTRGIGFLSGQVDLSQPHGIRHVISIDGGQAIVPNAVVQRKAAACLSVCAILVDLAYIRSLRNAPIVDPRELARRLDGSVRVDHAIVPLSGISLPGETVRDTIRNVVHHTLVEHGLYPTLQFLLTRPYDPNYQLGVPGTPHFRCRSCREPVYIPSDAPLQFACTHCGFQHYHSDWLGIAEDAPDDWAREDAVSNLRNVMEALRLFHYIRKIDESRPELFSEFLFVKDGPLGLWAKTSGLVDPIKSYISWLRDNGRLLNLIGVEKNGDLVNQAEEIKQHLPDAGMFFLPSQRYLIEEVAGCVYDPSVRNTVQYGAKLVARAGPQHVLALTVPTGDFLHDPVPADLIGFDVSLRALAELLSFRYENALVPLVLANQFASISVRPSGDILQRFLENRVNKRVGSPLERT